MLGSKTESEVRFNINQITVKSETRVIACAIKKRDRMILYLPERGSSHRDSVSLI